MVARLWPFALLALQMIGAYALQLPNKTYGVNLGSWQVIEPWMMEKEWARMGGERCDDCSSCIRSEFALAQKFPDTIDSMMKEHWQTWFTQADVNTLKEAGINHVRIPLGYWIIEPLVDRETEFFPRGGFSELRRGLKQLRDAGIIVMLDHHALPGASAINQMFAGRCTNSPEFFTEKNYHRALVWSAVMAAHIHLDPAFSSVVSLQAVNEPIPDARKTPGFDKFMKDFASIIRVIELGIGLPLAGVPADDPSLKIDTKRAPDAWAIIAQRATYASESVKLAIRDAIPILEELEKSGTFPTAIASTQAKRGLQVRREEVTIGLRRTIYPRGQGMLRKRQDNPDNVNIDYDPSTAGDETFDDNVPSKPNPPKSDPPKSDPPIGNNPGGDDSDNVDINYDPLEAGDDTFDLPKGNPPKDGAPPKDDVPPKSGDPPKSSDPPKSGDPPKIDKPKGEVPKDGPPKSGKPKGGHKGPKGGKGKGGKGGNKGKGGKGGKKGGNGDTPKVDHPKTNPPKGQPSDDKPSNGNPPKPDAPKVDLPNPDGPKASPPSNGDDSDNVSIDYDPTTADETTFDLEDSPSQPKPTASASASPSGPSHSSASGSPSSTPTPGNPPKNGGDDDNLPVNDSPDDPDDDDSPDDPNDDDPPTDDDGGNIPSSPSQSSASSSPSSTATPGNPPKNGGDNDNLPVDDSPEDPDDGGNPPDVGDGKGGNDGDGGAKPTPFDPNGLDLSIPVKKLDPITITYMEMGWQNNNPSNPADATIGRSAYDQHLYFCFGGVAEPNEESYLRTICNMNRAKTAAGNRNAPLIAGEWSLATNFDASDEFLKKWADAQKLIHSQSAGWMFWSAKIEEGGAGRQWSYLEGLRRGYFTQDPSAYWDATVCDKYRN